MLEAEPPKRAVEWRQRSLGDLIAKVEAGVSVNSEDRVVQNGELGVLKTSCVAKGLFEPEEHKAVLEGERERVKVPVRGGCIIMSRMNTPALVGANAYVPQDCGWLFLPDRLWQLHPAAGIDGRWLSLVTGHPGFRAMISSVATGTSNSMKNVSQEAVLQLPVTVPPLEEQRRIAEILSTWGAAVEAATRARGLLEIQYRAIAAKKIHMRGPNMRLLKELLTPDRMQTVEPNGPFRALGVRSHGKGTFQREDDLTANGSTKTVYRVEADRFVVNIVFAWEGAAAITARQDAGCLVSHRFPTFTVNRKALSLEYFRHLIRTEPFRQLLALASPGGAGRNKTLNRNDLLKFEIHVPPLPEQTAVATALGALDRRLTLLDEYLQRLTVQRDALATELLTGRLRVPQVEAAS